MSATAVIAEEVFIHPQAPIETGEISPGARMWAFAHVMRGGRIGVRCNICDHAFVESGAVPGNGVTVKNGMAIRNGVTIEDNVFLRRNWVLTNVFNPRAAATCSACAREFTSTTQRLTLSANPIPISPEAK